MARAHSAPSANEDEHEPAPGDWQALRTELVGLLDQVETQFARAGGHDPDQDQAGVARRVSELRHTVDDTDPDGRHNDALRSVKRAIDRFNAGDEKQDGGHGAQRDAMLRSAIDEIRDRQTGAATAPSLTNAVRIPGNDRVNDFTQVMSGIGARLEQIETGLKSQRGNSTHIREIADQVSQLSHVVELLAGAVGETGQVKRLESQIENLAAMIGDAPKVDLSVLNQRLEEVAATVERLADLQVQQIQHVVREAEAGPAKAQDMSAAMDVIEKSVRQIYDRIDAMERSAALPSPEIDRLTRSMAQFTNEMRTNNGRPEGLLKLVDALNARISNIEGRDETLGNLKLDLGELRTAVTEAIEPRFTALETSIAQLDDKLAGNGAQEPGIAQIEVQIRQLVARMDQTGEQLSDLTRLYNEAEGRQVPPDFEALANLAATRTLAGLQGQANPHHAGPWADEAERDAFADLVAARASSTLMQTPAPAAPEVSDKSLSRIEQRVAQLLKEREAHEPEGDNAALSSDFEDVKARLDRLEVELAPENRDKKPETSAAAPAPGASVEDGPEPAIDTYETSSLSEVAQVSDGPDDIMPHSPAEDRPLTEFGFPDLGPVQAALEAKNGPRKLHPGLHVDEAAPPLPAPPIAGASLNWAPESADAPSSPQAPAREETEVSRAPVRPDFDPETVERPAAPQFHLGAPDDMFAFRDSGPSGDSDAPTPDRSSQSSRNTFIEAARRAAQRQNPTSPAASSNSLIGRALARFQASGETGDNGAPSANTHDGEPQMQMGASTPTAPLEVKPDTVAEPKRKKSPKSLFKRGKKRAAPDAGEPETSTSPIAPPIGHELPPEPVPGLFADLNEETGENEANPIKVDPEANAQEGDNFLVRHSKPILLVVSIIAISVLTLNLVMQRNQEAQSQAKVSAPALSAPIAPTSSVIPPAATAKPATATISPAAPLADPTAADARLGATPGTPRVIAMTDSLTTGSIDPGAVDSFSDPGTIPSMPPALVKGSNTPDATPGMIADSPVKVDMPPEAVGPLDLRKAAANGDARAQFEVAAIYSEGRAVPADFTQASIWYERSAAQGFAPAQYRLGSLYENGKGVKKDLEQARLWYQRAAEAGNRMSMHNLAALYAGGKTGNQDFASAAEWFEQAAARDMTDSQYNLGMLYARGLGVKQDVDTSYKWFALAAKHGDAGAAKARDDIVKSLDAATLKRLNEEVDAWKPTSIDLAANFAPIGTWEKNFNPGDAITNKNVVTKVQTALLRLGFDVGVADGSVGPKTSDAIKAFEHATGMSEVGQVNPRLLAVLGSQPV